MSSLTDQIEQLKNRYLQNKYESTILNEIITQINAMQNNANAPPFDVMAITSLRKVIVKQIIENDQHDANACKRHMYITQIVGRPKNTLARMS